MGLTFVVIEEHTWRPVHLAYDYALGSVHNERPLIGHQRDIPEIDLLFFDFLDRLGAGIFVNIKHDELQAHLQRRGICQISLHTLFGIELRRLELVAHIFQ